MIEVIALVTIAFTIFLLSYLIYRPYRVNQRETAIDNFQFPDAIAQKVIDTYPQLSQDDAEQVIRGLREYFHICNMAGRQPVSMPSQVVDVAWHEFILFTRQYEVFCKKAFGRFLHHTPAEAMGSQKVAHNGIRVAWRISCFREQIVPNLPNRLPLLFALDRKLNIPDGFKYSVKCIPSKEQYYCASDILGPARTGRGGSSGCSGAVSLDCMGGCGSV